MRISPNDPQFSVYQIFLHMNRTVKSFLSRATVSQIEGYKMTAGEPVRVSAESVSKWVVALGESLVCARAVMVLGGRLEIASGC